MEAGVSITQGVMGECRWGMQNACFCAGYLANKAGQVALHKSCTVQIGSHSHMSTESGEARIQTRVAKPMQL